MARIVHPHLRDSTRQSRKIAPSWQNEGAQAIDESDAGILNDRATSRLSPRLKHFLLERLGAASRESLLAFYFSNCGRQVGNTVVLNGQRSHLLFEPLRLVSHGIRLDARSLVIAHNHPGGTPLPSLADLATTRKLAALAWTRGLVLAEHLIVGRKHIFSMRRSRIES